MVRIVLVGAAALLLAACQSDSQRDRTLVGGGLGAATGAVIGAAATGDVGGALVGELLGLGQLGAGARARDQIVGFLRHRPGDLGAEG